MFSGSYLWLADRASTENHTAVTGFETVASDFTTTHDESSPVGALTADSRAPPALMMCPLPSGPFDPFDMWLLCPGFYLYGPGPFVWVFAFRRIAWLYFVILCFISVVLGGQGFWPVVGWGVPFSGFNGFLGLSP